MVGVILCSKARFFSAANTRSISSTRMSAARVSCTLKQVSSTSEEVMPWCTKRASGPTISARWVVKARTSCLVSRSISSIRSMSKVTFFAFAQIVFAASFGITPSSAWASAACASISNQILNRVCGSQIAAISGRV